MSRYGAEPSNRLQTSWQTWGTYFSLIGASLFLLLFEQAQFGRTLWDWARLTSAPGLQVVQFLRAGGEDLETGLRWRQLVTQRVAVLEAELQEQAHYNAQLTLQLQAITTATPAAALTRSLTATDWFSTEWEGVPGAWQIRAGCQQGLVIGDPVVHPDGILVGMVSEVQRSYSLVQAWDSASLSVPVRVGTASAVAKVQGGRNEVQLASLRWPSPVRDGDTIFTAGNQLVPRNVIVGSVQHLQAEESFGEAHSQVLLPLQPDQLSEVFVPLKGGETCVL